MNVRGKAAPVEQEHHLAAVAQGVFYGVVEARAQCVEAAAARALVGVQDGLDVLDRLTRVVPGEVEAEMTGDEGDGALLGHQRPD